MRYLPDFFLEHNLQKELNFHNLKFVSKQVESVMNALMLFVGAMILVFNYAKYPEIKKYRKVVPHLFIASFFLTPAFTWIIIKLELIDLQGSVPVLFMQEVYELLLYAGLGLCLKNIAENCTDRIEN